MLVRPPHGRWRSRSIGQPRVMGEVVAGILLGPTVLGAIAPRPPGARSSRATSSRYIGVAANLGLIFYMFLVGLEIDLAPAARAASRQAAAISNTSVALPMVAGHRRRAADLRAASAPTRRSPPSRCSWASSMSITAFPVLARILVERRMLKRPVGALALASAAIDDVTAWFLIALATAVAVAGPAADVVRDDRCSRSPSAWSCSSACGRCWRASRAPTTRRAACRAAGSRRSSPACCCPRTRPRRSASR